MSDDCCDVPATNGTGCCPVSGTAGQSVKWTTVSAMTSGPVPPRQDLALCCDAECEVVYFGEHGLTLRTNEVRVVPGFKLGAEDLVCYCFLHSREAITTEAEILGESPTLESIRASVKKKECACEVRNPAGKCCLRDVLRVVDAAISKEGVTE